MPKFNISGSCALWSIAGGDSVGPVRVQTVQRDVLREFVVDSANAAGVGELMTRLQPQTRRPRPPFKVLPRRPQAARTQPAG